MAKFTEEDDALLDELGVEVESKGGRSNSMAGCRSMARTATFSSGSMRCVSIARGRLVSVGRCWSASIIGAFWPVRSRLAPSERIWTMRHFWLSCE